MKTVAIGGSADGREFGSSSPYLAVPVFDSEPGAVMSVRNESYRREIFRFQGVEKLIERHFFVLNTIPLDETMVMLLDGYKRPERDARKEELAAAGACWARRPWRRPA